MRVTDFAFELPESLIAHYPMPERSSCRLLSLDGPTGALTHGTFTDILDKLNPGDLLVFNNTRVIPARLFGRKASGGSELSARWARCRWARKFIKRHPLNTSGQVESPMLR